VVALAALRAQNLQVSAGILNQPPTPSAEAYQINVEALGRLSTPEQFANIIVKSDNRGPFLVRACGNTSGKSGAL